MADADTSIANPKTVDSTRGPSAISSHGSYARFAPIYDWIYGPGLQPGRAHALKRLALQDGESILEVGVGTGLSAIQYPKRCRIVAVDMSAPMLARAQARLARRGVEHVALVRMDAARLAFADGQFDAVYAPYLINTVTDPSAVAREMGRVCRRGGRIVFLNHFQHTEKDGHAIDRILGKIASRMSGVNWDLPLGALLRDAELTPESVESVNFPPVSSVVVCRKR